MPPKITVPPGANNAEPGVFKSIHGIVRLVDLRVRFGVDEEDFVSPGKIIIVEVEGGYAGFWVDEIEDVISFPKSGWSSLPAYIPSQVFKRTLIRDDNIRLYADFENLDKFKSTGYLRKHIEMIKAKISKAEIKRPQPVNKKQDMPENTEAEEAAVKIEAEQQHKSELIEESKHKDSLYNAEKNTDNKKIADTKKPDVINREHKPDATTKHSFAAKSENITTDDTSKSDYVREEKHTPQKDIRAEKNSRENHTPLPQSNETKPLEKHKTNNENNKGSGLVWLSLVVALLVTVALVSIELFDSDVEDKNESRQNKRLQTQLNKQAKIFNNVEDTSFSAEVETQAKADAEVAVKSANEGISAAETKISDGNVKISKVDDGVLIVINDYVETEKIEQNEHEEPVVEPAIIDNNVAQSTDREAEKITDAKDVIVLTGGNVTIDNGLQQTERVLPNVNSEKQVQQPRSKKYVHVVVKGDTLWHIAKRYVHNPWRYPELAKLSDIKNPDLIYPGEQVVIIINYR